MPKSENLMRQLEELAAACTLDSLVDLDLDRIRDMLLRQRRLIAEHDALLSDLAALRQDYIERISGMAKAIAAVTSYTGAAQARDTADTVIEYLRSLETMTVVQLIEQYRLASARFRAAFPTSFARLR